MKIKITCKRCANKFESDPLRKTHICTYCSYPNETDNVDNPIHYITGDIEVIDYIRDKLTKEQFIGFCIGNIIKYMSRYRYKGGIEDLKKAEKYFVWAIERAEENDRVRKT